MPPYHHPELPTDMLSNFNDLHAEISALPRSRADALIADAYFRSMQGPKHAD